MTISSLADALHSDRPAADRAERMSLYELLVGSWSYDAIYHPPEKPVRTIKGDIHAGWVLDGRALQDVWIVPARGIARASPPEFGDYCGTTLRMYDPGLDAWHILWADPLTQTYYRQLGRARGRDIVQEGRDEATGAQVRWSFTDITTNSFRWLGEASPDGGVWTLLADFQAKRIN